MRRRIPPFRSLQRRTLSTQAKRWEPKWSPAEYLSAAIKYDGGPEGYNAFVTLDADAENHTEPALTVAVKDNICTAFFPTTCSSLTLSTFRPPYDATCVRLLREAGAQVVGKTNMDEFGMGSWGVHSLHGAVRNPRDMRRVAGGSSSGSAAAVAAGLCDVALGTDTGGSTRLPASHTHTYGLKPSYGLISRHGLISYADSLDTIGLLARSIPPLRAAFQIVAQPDKKDPTSAPLEVREAAWRLMERRLDQLDGVRGLRVGVPADLFPASLSPAAVGPLQRALEGLKARGAEIKSVRLPSTKYALSAYYVIASAEASSNLARYDGVRYGFRAEETSEEQRLQAGSEDTASRYARTRTKAFGEEVKKRLLLGTYALTADAFDNYFLQAQLVRKLIKKEYDALFRAPNVLSLSPSELAKHTSFDSDQAWGWNEAGVDVLLHPSAVGPAPLLEDVMGGKGMGQAGDGLAAYVQDVLSVPASLAGLPSLNVPVPPAPTWSATDGDAEQEVKGELEVGVSVVGQWGWDELVLEVGEAIARGEED